MDEPTAIEIAGGDAALSEMSRLSRLFNEVGARPPDLLRDRCRVVGDHMVQKRL